MFSQEPCFDVNTNLNRSFGVVFKNRCVFLDVCAEWLSRIILMVSCNGYFLLYRKDRLRRSFELKMPAGRWVTQTDDSEIRKDKNFLHQIPHQDRHHLRNSPYPIGLPRTYGEGPWK